MTLRIGILGAARVARYAMIDAAHAVAGVSVTAVAARDPVRARAFADAHGIARVLPDYAALVADPAIDAVYIALPPNLHAIWSIAAVKAGKPVLCEKPFALTLADAKAMVAAETAHGGMIMEAQHSHYHPLSGRMRDMLHGGTLGDIISIDARFDAPVDKMPGEIRYLRDVGGGALWDLGVYPAYWVRSALGKEPSVLSASQRHAPGGADIATTARLTTSSGADITLACAMDAPFRAYVNFVGTRGTLRISNPLQPHSGHRFQWTIDGVSGDETFDGPTTYAAQLAAFHAAVVHGAAVPTRGDDSVATIGLLTAIDTIARQE